MVRRYDLSMLCRVNDGDDDRCGLDAGLNAVFDVESDVGHGLLTFCVNVLRYAPTRRTRGWMALSTTY